MWELVHFESSLSPPCVRVNLQRVKQHETAAAHDTQVVASCVIVCELKLIPQPSIRCILSTLIM